MAQLPLLKAIDNAVNLMQTRWKSLLDPLLMNALLNPPNGKSGQVLTSTGGSNAPVWGGLDSPQPTIQKFLSGSGTYITPQNPAPAYIEIELIGGGGGGGGGTAQSTPPTIGGNTTFGSGNYLLTGNGGGYGQTNVSPPTSGGTASLGSSVIGVALQGGDGGTGGYVDYATGGQGASSPFGAGGYAGNLASGTLGDNAVAPGSGGGGGGGRASPVAGGGSGGSAGGYCKGVILNPVKSYPYSVGAGGTGGISSSGTNAGSGASGIIIVREYYDVVTSKSSSPSAYVPPYVAPYIPQFAQAYHSQAYAWITTSSTFVDATVDTIGTFNVRYSNNITITAAGSNLPGITFTPQSPTASYLIMANISCYHGAANGGCAAILTDGTVTIAQAPGQQAPTAGTVESMMVSGPYTPGVTTPVTVKLQIAMNAGYSSEMIMAAISNGVPVEWTILRIA